MLLVILWDILYFFFFKHVFFFTIKFCLWTVFWWHLSGRSPPSWRTAVGGFTEGRAGPRLPTAPWELQAGGESHWARTRRLSTQHCRQRASASPGPRPRGARWSQTTAALELGWAAAEEQGPRARSFCSGELAGPLPWDPASRAVVSLTDHM